MALTPAEAAAGMKLPPGFKATVFAAEPDLQNPIALAWDARGRLWIAENYTYAEATLMFDLALRDRILVFEDKNGDGRFSSRRVFHDTLQRLTSLEVGHGGVWAMCPPQLLFIPDRDGDGGPDGEPQVVLDGFTVHPEKNHTVANGLRFGPDGWLYGRCGGSSPAEIGLPGTRKEDRLPLRGALWRYHPHRRVVEVLNSGTTNPWGHDWNAHGELFFINSVNGHLWHSITGAHYLRGTTLEPNPAVYDAIEQHVDHWHFDTGLKWTQSRDGAGTANSYGGGHAHVGMTIYQGDNWPAEYRGGLFTLNFHGRRANREILERKGSGYVGRPGADAFFSSDPWFRGIEISYGPDGGAFVLDWSDIGECHDSTGVHRLSGRAYKITYGDPKRPAVDDIAKLNARELIALHSHPNEWFVRQARLELAARAADGRGTGDAARLLREIFERNDAAVMKLRALWSLYVAGATDDEFLRAQLGHDNEHVRVWAIRLLSDGWPLDTVMSRRPARAESAGDAALLADFARLAKTDPSGLVRLSLASVLQRLPVNRRAALASALAARPEDAGDHNLPLLIWYGLILLAEADPAQLLTVAASCELPRTRTFIARRLAEDLEKNPAPIDGLIAIARDKPAAFQGDIITGMADGLTGWRQAPKPGGWDAFAASMAAAENAAVRDSVRELSVLFGDGRALDEVRRVALDGQAGLSARQTALRTLIASRPPDLRQVCEQVLNVQYLNTIAVGGLAQFDDPAIGENLARRYLSFAPSERGALIETLVARPGFAQALLGEIRAGRIPRTALTPFHARQIRGFGDARLTQELTAAWGESREPAADKRALVARLKAGLTPETLRAADLGKGRVVYANLCAACHTLYGQGGQIGPDLTGSGRDNIDYLLENIADPSAVVSADFRLNLVTLRDGRTLSGFVAGTTPRTLTIRTMTEAVTVEHAEITARQELPQSLMPEGLLEAISSDQTRDLVAYLMHQGQVPLPNAASPQTKDQGPETRNSEPR